MKNKNSTITKGRRNKENFISALVFLEYFIYQKQKIIINKGKNPQQFDGVLQAVAYPFKTHVETRP